MIAVTFSGNPAYLIDDPPDWESAVTLTAEIPAIVEKGLNAIEMRRQQGDTPRLSFSFSSTITGNVVLTNLRNSLQALNTQPVLCPLWPAMFGPGDTPPISAPYYVEIGDGGAPVIVAASALPLSRQACPLMIGRLAKTVEPEMLRDDAEIITFDFTENADSYLTPPAFVPANGPASAIGTPALFAWRPDWSSSQKSGGAFLDVDRKNIGQIRTTADAYYTQAPRRTSSQSFTLYNGEPWNLLSFFAAAGATEQAFWLPACLSEAQLTADVLSADTSLTVDNPGNIGNNSYVLLDDTNNRTCAQVTGTAGSTWTLSGAVGTAFAASATRLESLLLARFDDTRIELKFFDLGMCDVEISFREVPYEVTGGSAESIGATFGPMPTNASLFVFEIEYPSATETFYFTSFERDLTDGSSNVYAHAPFEHQDIVETDALDRQEVVIKSRNLAGAVNPLSLLIPYALEWPLQLTIYEADVSGNTAENLRALFSGEVSEISPDGPFLSATAKSMSHIFDLEMPRRLYQPNCNWVLFEAGCTLLRANWTWTGTVTSYNTSTGELVIGSVASTSSNGAALKAAFFAGGYVYFGAGSAVQYRALSASDAESGSSINLYLSQGFNVAPAPGTTVYFLPGCDGQYANTCIAKFGNGIHFGGTPFIPAADPTFMQTNSASGGKK